MENSKPLDLDRWVNGHLAALNPPHDWQQPDTAAGLEQFRRGRRLRSTRRKARSWTGAGLAAIFALILAFPSTRVFARRCVDACLAELPMPQRQVATTPPAAGIIAPGKRQLAANLERPDLAGSPVRLSDLEGRVVLLNFWATWCGPCKTEIPWFMELQQQYGGEGLTIVGISLDDDGWTSVTPYAQNHGINYRLVLGDGEIAGRFGGVEALPATFLIDRRGRIAATFTGLTTKDIYEKDIQQLLAEK